MEQNYQVLEIELRSSEIRSRRELHIFLKSLGFTSLDDFYFLPRRESHPKWQASSIVSLDIFLGGKGVNEIEEDWNDGSSIGWDSIKSKYLLAWLPESCSPVFIEKIAELQSKFSLELLASNSLSSVLELEQKIREVSQYLKSEYDAPGSEGLAIYLSLQKRRF